MKRVYKYSSGHAKRMKKMLKEEQERTQQGSIKKFCFTLESQQSTSIKNTDSENNSCDCENSEIASTSFEINNQMKESSAFEVNNSSSGKSEIDHNYFSELKKTESINFEIVEDPALWNNISEQFREYIVTHPPKQNEEKLNLTERKIGNVKRYLTEKHFYRTMKNGDKLKREWLILSPSNHLIYCYVCKLFSMCNSALASSGFCDWKHVSERLTEHENSSSHRKSVCTLASRVSVSDRIDSQLVLQFQTECKYWEAVLIRIVAVVKFLAKRGLPFFGSDETLGSLHNGNFLGCLELISEFDPFLAKHLENFGNPGKGHVNYLSSSVVNEFVSLMAKKVLNEIINEVKIAKYFSIIVDSTPDMSHVDQLSFVVRYVDSSLRPVERYLTFIPIQFHGSEYLANTVFSTLENYKLDIMNIRGQSYDNASNMSGKYTGLQARIKEVNPLAEYVPCSAHTLNLVVMHSVESCTQVVIFFSLLQELYNFFSASTHRWNILKEECKKNNSVFTLKSHSSTRWCADADATKSLRMNYREVVYVLNMLSGSSDESALTRHEASSLSSKLQKLETAINAVVWDSILQRLNKASKQLQKTSENLECVLPLFNSLVSFVQYVRENFDIYEQEAKLINVNSDYEIVRKKRVPKSRLLDDGDAPPVQLSPRDNFRVTCHNALCDAIISQLTSRKISYENVVEKFSFLINCDANEVSSKADIFQQHYNADLDNDFSEEYQQFLPIKQKTENIIDTLQNLHKLNMRATFPNVETALKLFLTLPISNCTSERSFSLLKRLKSPLRTTLGQEKLSALAILSFENDITTNLDYIDIIREFASQKIRKKPF